MFTLDQSTIQMIISVSYTINLIKSLTDGASPLELNNYDRLDKGIQMTAKNKNKTKKETERNNRPISS